MRNVAHDIVRTVNYWERRNALRMHQLQSISHRSITAGSASVLSLDILPKGHSLDGNDNFCSESQFTQGRREEVIDL